MWYIKFWELVKGRPSRKPGANQQTRPGFLSLGARVLSAVLSFSGESCVHEAFRERSFLRGRGMPVFPLFVDLQSVSGKSWGQGCWSPTHTGWNQVGQLFGQKTKESL